MDFKLVSWLPSLNKPRRGRLEGISKSEEKLSKQEVDFATRVFKDFTGGHSEIDYQELRALLFALNFNISEDLMNSFL